jgi:hypothetical protein
MVHAKHGLLEIVTLVNKDLMQTRKHYLGLSPRLLPAPQGFRTGD